MGGNAMRSLAANVATRATFASSKPPLTQPEAAERLRDAVRPLSAAELAQAAHATKSAAKGWKNIGENRGAAYWCIANMARAFAGVQDMVFEDIGFDRAAQAGSVDALINQLYRIAVGEGQEAWLARQMINKLREPNPQIDQDNVIQFLVRRAA